jgi:uncharacterized protein YndB with AHSA1/START domain
MKLDARATVHVPRPPEQVFDFAVANQNLSRMLQRKGPIPGVTGAELIAEGESGGTELRAGARRRVSMTYGSTLIEEVIALDRPQRHEYRWAHPPPPPFSLLIRGGHATWTFVPDRGGTRVDWLYTFELASPLALPLAAVAVALFKSWMGDGLARLRAALV